MLKANVGLSRKLSENYQSAGFSLNLEGEINATLDDPEAVIERIREFFDLAHEALDRQVEAHTGDSSIASRDAGKQPGINGQSNGLPVLESTRPPTRKDHLDETPPAGDAATNKQVQFLLTLAKRQRLQGPKLEAFIAEVVGRGCSPYDLTRKEAGAVIDALNPEAAAENNRSRR